MTSLRESLSVDVLARITLLQSMVILLPDKISMLKFICKGLQEVAGVESISYRLPGRYGSTERLAEEGGAVHIFPIQYKEVNYAELVFAIADQEAFTPYVPFLLNFTNMLGVSFEVLGQRRVNQLLMEKLEQRVVERTRALEEKSEDLRITLQSIGDGVISTDVDGRITSMNPVAEKLTGWPLEEAIGKELCDIFRIYNARTGLTADDPVRKVLATGQIVDLSNHTALIARDGTRRQIADSASPINDRQGNLRGVVLIFRDETESYQAAQALKESEEKYRMIVEGTGDLVSKTDDTGRFTYVNRCARRIFGVAPADCLGRSAFDFIHPDDRDRTRTWFQECVRKKVKQSLLENRQVNQTNGDIFHFLWTCNFHYDDMGQLLMVNSVAHDITERKREEEEKTRLEAQLRQAQKMESVGQLAGGVAHDFNNMLCVILGHAEIAMNQLNPSMPVFADLEEIRKAANRSSEITRQLLAFARKQAAIPKEVDLNEVVEVMLKMLRRLIGEDIELTWLPKASPSTVKIDPVQVDQILANLCVNARDAIDGGGKIFIETANCSFDEKHWQDPEILPGKYVMLAVTDNGLGMDGETQSHIFEPFFTTKEIGQGTGLGLSTVYGIVRQNSGFIKVDSKTGRGTTFKIYLPLDEETTIRNENETDKSAQGGKETILLVEDEPMIREMAGKMLEMMGYHVLYADDPADAIALVDRSEDEIHLLLTDVIMPGMNGWDLANRLLTKQPRMKCLFMSGYAPDIIARQGILEQGMHFIPKPFSRIELTAKVREALTN